MKNARRFGWAKSLFRTDRRGGEGAPPRARRGRAARLAAMAGGAIGEHGVERLEQRQLLFTLTVGPGDIDPNTGLGTVRREFYYQTPTLVHEQITAKDPTLVNENFDDEMQGWTQGVPAAPPSGTRFDMSNIQIAYSSGSTTPVQLVRRGGGGGGQTDNALRVALAGTDSVTFTFFSPDGQGTGNPRLATRATVAIGNASAGLPNDGDGLKTDPNTGSRIDLLLDGRVVATFSGAALAALATPIQGNLSLFTLQIPGGGGFDSFRIRSAADAPANASYADNFVIETIGATLPSGTFADETKNGRFYAEVAFTGPVGATVQFLDLYGRDMVAGRIPSDFNQTGGGGQEPDPNDRDDNGVPETNIGIGRINIAGTNARSSMTLIGFKPAPGQNPNRVTAGPNGFAGDFQGGTNNFGFVTVPQQGGNTDVVVAGLAPAGVSVIVGSPWVNPLSQYRQPAQNLDFARADQGVFVTGGASIGSVQIWGALFGSSKIDGAADRFAVGVLYGSVRVDGDVGTFTVQGDAGTYFNPTPVNQRGTNGVVVSTGARLTVGRTVREIDVGGRNAMATSVLADVNNPARARLNYRDFYSREVAYSINPQQQGGASLTGDATLNNAGFWQGGQSVPFSTGFYRNDSVPSAEFVGYNGTSVRIHGAIDGLDPVNTGQDLTDVYAFPADNTREVVVSVDTTTVVGMLRVVDRDGNVLVALDAGGYGRGPNGARTASSVLRFTPTHSDVYYLVVNDAFGGASVGSAPYTVSITGMAPVTLGQFRAVLGTDPDQSRASGTSMSLSLSSGDAGSVRIGTGVTLSDGSKSAGAGAVFTALPDAITLLTWGDSSVNLPGNLFNALAGTSMNGTVGAGVGLQLLVRGNIGSVDTGLSELGTSVNVGDMYNADIRAGGTIGVMNVRGTMGARQIQNAIDATDGTVNIQTGTAAGLRGDIGQILIGGYMAASGVTITTSPGSQVDQIIVGANNDGAGTDFPGQIWYGQNNLAPRITVGAGSDVRFLTYTSAGNNTTGDVVERIGLGQSRTYVDDAGASVTISLSGGVLPTDNTQPDPRAGSFIDVRFIPINGSRGVAIARIDATLLGGVNLLINGTTQGVVSIGRIVINNAAGGQTGGTGPQPVTVNPSILIQGTAEIDVNRIDVRAGALDGISNTTPGGDIVFIDAAGLRTLTVNGSLGRTQTIAANTDPRGFLLGITTQGGTGGVGAPLFVNPASINVVRAILDASAPYLAPVENPYRPMNANSYLSVIGSPIDAHLDGVVVRAGDLESVRVNGTVGDVIVQGGHLLNLVANADGVTPQGGFQGIEGNVYAPVIGTVNVGDGLRGTGPSSLAAASIVADTAIVSLVGVSGRTPGNGALIQGYIAARGLGGAITQVGTNTLTPVRLGTPVNGIGTIDVTNGRYDNAFIHAGALDDFWTSLNTPDEAVLSADVTLVRSTGGDVIRTAVDAQNVGAVTITGGVWDANSVTVSNNVGQITADRFLNSTRLGTAAEIFVNQVKISNNLGALFTNGLADDVSDLNVTVGGSLTGRIAGRNLIRSSFGVANVATLISATNDVRSTTVQAGRLVSLTAGQDLRSVTLQIAGPVETVTAAGEITQLELNSTGPDGRVDLLRAQGRLTGNVTSSGNIGVIESVTSDVSGNIATRNDDVRANNGGLATLRAGRDLDVAVSILGNTGTVFAKRNIGRIDAQNRDLDLRGNVGNVTAETGQLYDDLLVGGSITGTVKIGRVSMLPGNDLVGRGAIVAFGRINAVDVQGDFNADIISRSGGIGTITLTSGSFRPGNRIEVTSGDLTQLTLKGGDLLGDVLVDGNIGRIDVLVGPDGFKGQIGIASWRRNSKRWLNDIRNELPPDVSRSTQVDGVTIRAGGSIGAVFVERGSMTESQIIAGENIGDVNIALQLRNDALNTGLNNAIVAGNRIGTVTVGGFTGAVAVLAGVRDLGADGRVGGVGDDLDVVGPGSIGAVNFNGPKAVNSVVAAGVAPDPATGRYSTSDALLAVGRSSVDSVSARNAINVTAASAGTLGSTSAGIARVTGQAQQEPDLVLGGSSAPGQIELVRGVSLAFTLPSGDSGRATFSGTGRIFFDPSTGTVRLLNTGPDATLTIAADGATLKNLKVLGNAGSSLGTLRVTGTINGNDARLFVNGGIGTLDLDVVDISGDVGGGLDIQTITVGSFLRGTLRARNVGTFTVRGDFGRPLVEREAMADFHTVGAVTVQGVLSGAISSDTTIPTVTLGSVNNGGVRSGASITTIVSGPTRQARFSAAGAIGSVTINGDADETDILGGGDLGKDADFGGDGFDADRVFAGSVGTVRVNGNFVRSSIAAGMLPGPSGFFGYDDVVAAGGRANIGGVTITGAQTGSDLGSQQYRVVATGTIGPVLVAGQAFTGAGNFRVERRDAIAVPVTVTDLFVTESARIYTVNLAFNQSIDLSTISGALSVFELRSGGATTVGLAEGTDYTLDYDREKRIVKVIFSRSVTERSLPQTAGVPGPGVYQFVLDADVLRGSTKDSLLDGNADGTPGDDFVRNAIVGDAGDKIAPAQAGPTNGISFYGAADLDLVLRRDASQGSLPEVNVPFTLSGTIGDHPNTDPDVFRIGGDVDVYRITLRAGQVLRLGEVGGVALGVRRALYDANGNPATAVVAGRANTSDDLAATQEVQYLIKQTGTYYIVVAGSLQGVNIADGSVINNIDPQPGAFGLYSFDVLVFDDQNGGFAGDTASGSGAPLVTPPVPLTFAGLDGRFGTADDLASFTQGDWVFTLTAGPSGPNAAGSVVRGVNSQGWTVTREANPAGRFGTVNDKITTTINSSIGLPGATGVPGDISTDVDVFLLNGGQPIAQGTKFRVTLRLTETGSDIGLDLRGDAQLALFEVPAGTGFDNAKLVAAPSEFLPIGNQKARTITDGVTSYGYDANGDYFFEFAIPGALGPSGVVPGVYALYLQGSVRSDYTLEIVQQGKATPAVTEQNVLLETRGGVIDWLEAGTGLKTALAAFNAAVIGFTGTIGGTPVGTYILNNLVSTLNAMFTAANVKINVSTDPTAFGRNPFSTVFLAGNVEPSAFFNNGTYGASQRVDAFNASKTDQAVVFMPALAQIGFEPTQAGVDQFVQALSAAVARRIGEIVGLRLETSVNSASTPIPVMASNSVALAGTSYGFVNQDRPLITLTDAGAANPNPANLNNTNSITIPYNFFLGTQNSQALIRRIVAARS